jgi:hypothetical protein
MAKKKTYQVGGNRAVITFPVHEQTGVGTQGVGAAGDRRPRTTPIYGQLVDPTGATISRVGYTSSSDGTFCMMFGTPMAPLVGGTLYKFQVSFSQNFNPIEDEIDFTA